MPRRWIYVILLMAAGHLAAGATDAANWRPVTPRELNLTAKSIGDAEAEAAILFREGELNDNIAEGTSLKLYIRIKIFNDRGRRYGEIQLPFRAELGRITDVSARTIRPDGSIVEVEGSDILDKIILKTSQSVWRAKVISMPAIEAGAIIEYRYRIIYPRGFRYFALDLQSDLFTKELHYQIQPQSQSKLDVRWVSFNTTDPKRFVPAWDGAFNIKVEDIPAFRREPFMPPDPAVKMWGWLYYSNEFETEPESYWREYARRSFARTSDDTSPTRAIRRVVETITLSTRNPNEAVSRIYDYIQKEIYNTGFGGEADRSPGSAAQTRNDSPGDVLSRRHGNPREINRLFIAMLRAAGLDARVAELVTRDESLFYRSFPDAFQFNSELAAVVAHDGSIRFYDPGTPFCPQEMLSWEKEGTTALVYGKRDWRFVETPVARALCNSEDRLVTVQVAADGRVDARVELKITGQRAIELRRLSVDPGSNNHHKLIMTGVRALHPAASINESAVAVSNLNNSSAPFAASYSFSLPQFAARTETRLLLAPALLNHTSEPLLPAPNRSNNLYFHYPRAESERVIISLPESYEVEQLPEAVEIDIGAARYEARFKQEGQRVVYDRRLIVDAINFKADQYQTVKAFFDRVHQADRRAVSFKQR